MATPFSPAVDYPILDESPSKPTERKRRGSVEALRSTGRVESARKTMVSAEAPSVKSPYRSPLKARAPNSPAPHSPAPAEKLAAARRASLDRRKRAAELEDDFRREADEDYARSGVCVYDSSTCVETRLFAFHRRASIDTHSLRHRPSPRESAARP